MLLLSASLQRQVFDEENKAAVRLMAGDNVEICRDLDAASFSVHNPVPDFIHCRCYMRTHTPHSLWSNNIKLRTFTPFVARDLVEETTTRALSLVQFCFICIVLYAIKMLKQLFWKQHLQAGHNLRFMQSTNKHNVLWMLCRALACPSAANCVCVNMHKPPHPTFLSSLS